MTRYAIALGSNLGDRLANLNAGIAGIVAIGTVTGVSNVYETEPVGGPEQGRFLNAVAVVETDIAAHSLLDHLQEVETGALRERLARWGPRTLDLDIVASDGPPVESDRLVIPHRSAGEREFVLRPLCDVWDTADVGGVAARDALERIASQGVELIDENLTLPAN